MTVVAGEMSCWKEEEMRDRSWRTSGSRREEEESAEVGGGKEEDGEESWGREVPGVTGRRGRCMAVCGGVGRGDGVWECSMVALL